VCPVSWQVKLRNSKKKKKPMYISDTMTPILYNTHNKKEKKKESEKWVTWLQFSTHNFQAEYNRVLYEMEARVMCVSHRADA
jgi:hypothetical protein